MRVFGRFCTVNLFVNLALSDVLMDCSQGIRVLSRRPRCPPQCRRDQKTAPCGLPPPATSTLTKGTELPHCDRDVSLYVPCSVWLLSWKVGLGRAPPLCAPWPPTLGTACGGCPAAAFSFQEAALTRQGGPGRRRLGVAAFCS